MPRINRTPLLLVLASAIGLGFCVYKGDSKFSRFRFVNVNYCVPRTNVVEADYWWIPRDLPDDGFIFRVEVVFDSHINSRRILTGTVGTNHRSLVWSAPSKGSFPWTQGEVLVHEATRVFRDYFEGADGTIWQLTPPYDGRTHLNEGTKAMHCLSLANGKRSCTRIINLNSLPLTYHPDLNDLENIAAIDSALVKLIDSWKCD